MQVYLQSGIIITWSAAFWESGFLQHNDGLRFYE